MILIRGIDYMETDRDPIQILNTENPFREFLVMTGDGMEPVKSEAMTEFVNGVEYHRNGECFNIGMTKEIRDLLGMPMDAWEKMVSDNEYLLREVEKEAGMKNRYAQRISQFQTTPWWKRIWMALRGIL